MSFPNYIDRDGDRWTYGSDVNGDVGYHVKGGQRFLFEDEIDPLYEGSTISFEWVKGAFELVEEGARYCLVTCDEEHRQRVYGPFSEEDAWKLRTKLWNAVDLRGEVLHAEIIQHQVDIED